MRRPGNIALRQYMRANVELCVDNLTGEVNDTLLAEATFDHFNPEVDGEIPDNYFDCAIEVASQHEIKTGVKQGRCRAAGYINSIPGGSL